MSKHTCHLWYTFLADETSKLPCENRASQDLRKSRYELDFVELALDMDAFTLVSLKCGVNERVGRKAFTFI